MTQPAVNLTELDGALGVLPASAGKLHAVIGTAQSGPLNMPSTFGKPKAIVQTFGGGPGPEAAALYVEQTGKPVIFVRAAGSTAGANGAVDSTGKTGTSVVTLSGTPFDDYELAVRVVSGGTIGTPGITIQWSLDGGRTWSATVALASATTFAIPGSGVTLNFAAGTLVGGDKVTSISTAPAPSTADLSAALDALAASAASWEIAQIANPVDAAGIDLLELKYGALKSAGKYRAYIVNARIPTAGESEATYLAALSTALGSKATTHGEVCAGAAKIVSSVSGRRYRRPASFTVAARTAGVSEEINVADITLGPLPGVSIRDLNGNPDEHDESLNPGLDDARFTVLRTWDGYPGVYVNRPRLFSPPGSDFQLMPHRRVMNLAHEALRGYFIRRLNRPVIVSKETGFILEDQALEIESGATGAMRALLLAKPKASDVLFALSRTDNLLSTFTMTGDARVLPLAYPEFINLNVGFLNPALQVRAV